MFDSRKLVHNRKLFFILIVMLIGILYIFYGLKTNWGIIEKKPSTLNKNNVSISNNDKSNDNTNKSIVISDDNSNVSGSADKNISNDNSDNKINSTSNEGENISGTQVIDRDINAYLEDLVSNFTMIYPVVLSDKSLSISMLDRILIKNSSIYNEVAKEISDYQTDARTMEIKDFRVDNIEKDNDNLYNVYVEQSVITSDNKNETKKQYWKYTIYKKDNNIGIQDRYVWKKS